MLIGYLVLLIISAIILYICCEKLVKILIKISSFLGVREFVLAFFVMALASAFPNLFLGINSAINGVPDLSFGDVLGNNLVALTLAVALGVLFSKNKVIPTESRTVQNTCIFTFIAALLPLLLAMDGRISRGDALILILAFALYVFWLFSKQERFRKVFQESHFKEPLQIIIEFKSFIRSILQILGILIILFIASQFIIFSARAISNQLNVSLILIGLLMTGLINALPEIYFSINSARKGETWMVLGNLMGSVIFPATLVIGLIALIHPITISDFSSMALARFFLILALVFFFLFSQTDRKLSKKEALFLLFLYLIYIFVEILKHANT